MDRGDMESCCGMHHHVGRVLQLLCDENGRSTTGHEPEEVRWNHTKEREPVCVDWCSQLGRIVARNSVELEETAKNLCEFDERSVSEQGASRIYR